MGEEAEAELNRFLILFGFGFFEKSVCFLQHLIDILTKIFCEWVRGVRLRIITLVQELEVKRFLLLSMFKSITFVFASNV